MFRKSYTGEAHDDIEKASLLAEDSLIEYA